MKLTIFGATGGTGRHIVDQALEAGHHVTAVVRNPQRMPVSHPRLEVVTADITDADALVPAVRGRCPVSTTSTLFGRSSESPTDRPAGQHCPGPWRATPTELDRCHRFETPTAGPGRETAR